MPKQTINIPPISLEHKADQVHVKHSSGLEVVISEQKLSRWCLGLLRAKLIAPTEIPQAHADAMDSMAGGLK